uniref:Uncharacterized protein n=1 Tax=Ficedula albicollis TaxID=59894 RepID=A0A803VYR4_FICAL
SYGPVTSSLIAWNHPHFPASAGEWLSAAPPCAEGHMELFFPPRSLPAFPRAILPGRDAHPLWSGIAPHPSVLEALPALSSAQHCLF